MFAINVDFATPTNLPACEWPPSLEQTEAET